LTSVPGWFVRKKTAMMTTMTENPRPTTRPARIACAAEFEEFLQARQITNRHPLAHGGPADFAKRCQMAQMGGGCLEIHHSPQRLSCGPAMHAAERVIGQGRALLSLLLEEGDQIGTKDKMRVSAGHGRELFLPDPSLHSGFGRPQGLSYFLGRIALCHSQPVPTQLEVPGHQI